MTDATMNQDDVRLLNGILVVNAMRMFSGTNQLSAEEHDSLRDLRDRINATLPPEPESDAVTS